MPGRSQQESEQPAKVYQLDAVESKVISVDAKVNDALNKLDTIISQTKGVATLEQLESTKRDILTEVDVKIQNAEEAIHLRYGPMERNLTWFVRLVIGQGVTIVAGVIAAAIAIFGPK
jgi:hypothetical protein